MEPRDDTWRFEGFSSPNFTTVPDEFFDVLAPRLNGGEVKVLLYIIRRTFGFKKDRDSISISQMLNGIVRRDGTRLDCGAGLSKPSLCRAILTLAEKNIIIATRQFDFKGGNLATSYQLNMGGDRQRSSLQEASGTLGKKMRQGGVVSNFDQGLVSDFDQALVKKRDIQYTVNNKQVDKNVNVSKKAKGAPNQLHLLEDVHQNHAHVELITEDILQALGDTRSTAFYHLVARKVPEDVIRRSLSELKEGGVRSKPKVFTKRMMEYAKNHVPNRSHPDTTSLEEGRAALLAHMRYKE